MDQMISYMNIVMYIVAWLVAFIFYQKKNVTLMQEVCC